MLTDLVVGEHVILDLNYDLDLVVGVFDGSHHYGQGESKRKRTHRFKALDTK